MCKYGLSFSNELKFALDVHQKIDRRFVHVEDKTLVTIAAKDGEVHEGHAVKSFPLDFSQWALQSVCASSIGH